MVSFLLLFAIYIAYIGLGIPDSLFGTAWPVMCVDFGLPVHAAGYLTPLFSLFSVMSVLFSSKVINRFGTGKVTAFSTALTVVGLFGYSVSNNVLWIIFFAIPLGFGAGAVDSGINNYVALHYKAMHMSFLHCSYGVGVALSPYIMSKALEKTGLWQDGYRGAGIIQLVIAVLMFAALPLWSRVKHENGSSGGEPVYRDIGIITLLKTREVRLTMLCFLSSCSIEYLCNTYAASYFVECKGISPDKAAFLVMFYFIGLALGRFASGLLSLKLNSGKILAVGYVCLFYAFVLLMLPVGAVGAAAGLFLVGFGNGPTYPNLMHLTPISFGGDSSQPVIGVQMAAAYVGFMVMPFVTGGIFKFTTVSAFPIFAAVLYAVLVLSTVLYLTGVKKAGGRVKIK